MKELSQVNKCIGNICLKFMYENFYYKQNPGKKKFVKNAIVTSIKKINLFSDIKKVRFDDRFNGKISKMIPNCITHIHFGRYFDRDIRGVLPNTIEHLSFGEKFTVHYLIV